MKSIHVSLKAATAAASIFVVGGLVVAHPSGSSARSPSTASPTTKDAARTGTIAVPSLVASPSQLVIAANVGSQSSRTFSVTYAGAGGYLHVVQDSAALAPGPTVTPLGNGRFNVTLRTSDTVASGFYRGNLRLRMCAETPCVNAIEGATRFVPYRLMINWVNHGEWETYQRDAGHRGYVPIVVHASRIAKKWEWRTTTPNSRMIHPVATASGKVFVADLTWYPQSASLYALSELNGAQLWRHDFTDFYGLNPPAASGDKVYVASTGQSTGFLFAFKASDGAPIFHSSFDTQRQTVLAPTIKDGVAYTNGGEFGGGTYAYDAEDGMPLWSRLNGDDDTTTAAVEDGKVYYYGDEVGLQVYDSSNGNTTASIADPTMPEWLGRTYKAAPMLGSPDHVIALSGNDYWEFNAGRYLVDYSPANNAPRWTSVRRYTGTPAFKDGVIYATSNNPKGLDAIDEASGQVLWSWVPGPSDISFHNNVVVTRNVAFVTTNRATYAVDLATRQAVWSMLRPGQVAISGDGTLYIIPRTTDPAGDSIPTDTLIAFRLH